MSNEAPKHSADSLVETSGRDHLISNRTYDMLKYVALVALPAVGAFYFGIAQIWGIPYGPQVVGSITAFDTFLGMLLHISTKSYNNSSARYDGEINVTQKDEDSKLYSLNLHSDPNDLDSKKQVTFKVNPTS